MSECPECGSRLVEMLKIEQIHINGEVVDSQQFECLNCGRIYYSESNLIS